MTIGNKLAERIDKKLQKVWNDIYKEWRKLSDKEELTELEAYNLERLGYQLSAIENAQNI